LSPSSASPTYAAKTEYWSLLQTGMDALPGATGMTITGVGGKWPAPTSFQPVFTMPETVTWNLTSGGAGNPLFVYKVNDVPKVAILFQLTSPTGTTGWGGTLRWFEITLAREWLSPYVLGQGTFVFQRQTSIGVPAGSVVYQTPLLTPSALP
jgi:hypothetical protein